MGPIVQKMSVTDNDPQLALALVRMELRFGNMMSQFSIAFNAMLRFMKDGNVRQFRAAKAAMREMSESLRLTLETATGSLHSIPVP